MGAYKEQETVPARGVPWIGAGAKRRKEPFFQQDAANCRAAPFVARSKISDPVAPLEERRPGQEIRGSGCVVPDGRPEVSHPRSVGGNKRPAGPEGPTGQGL